jgi:hypothetical protein
MRAVACGVLVSLAIPAVASANTVGTATTTTGQTLTLSIDTPSDGVTAYGAGAAAMSGHVTLSAPGAGDPGTNVQSIAVGTGDAYEAEGSTYAGNASYSGYDTWGSYNQIAYEGTRKLYATAIAADGTRATANITITLDPKARLDIRAYGVLYDWRLFDDGTPALRASMFDRGPLFGYPVDFYVKNEKVCSASIGVPSGLYAVCHDPTAISKAIAAGGYEARYPGSANAYPASDTAGLVVLKPTG